MTSDKGPWLAPCPGFLQLRAVCACDHWASITPPFCDIFKCVNAIIHRQGILKGLQQHTLLGLFQLYFFTFNTVNLYLLCMLDWFLIHMTHHFMAQTRFFPVLFLSNMDKQITPIAVRCINSSAAVNKVIDLQTTLNVGSLLKNTLITFIPHFQCEKVASNPWKILTPQNEGAK